MQRFYFIIFAFPLLPFLASAQFGGGAVFSLPDELEVEVIPTYPEPKELVWLNLAMYTADLDSADIAWYKDGKQILVGKGLKQYSFRMGENGVPIDIEIRVRLQNGTSFSKKLSLTPSDVELIWEADSYVPPFYQGKALYPRQGRLKVVALPEFIKNGQPVAPNKLVYKWSDGLQVFDSQSGYGRNSIVLNGDILGSTQEVEVLVSDPTSNLVALGSIQISPNDQEIVVYENNPFYGFIFDQALSDRATLDSQETELFVAPFFFSKEARPLVYSWRMNGQALPELDGSRTAIFRKPDGQSGESSLSLEIQNPNKILQFSNKSFRIMFEN